MKQYCSLGGGVNSVAMLLLLTDQNEEFETIFVNHGGDYPHTYAYIDYLRECGFEITEIIPDVEGCQTIYDYSIKKQIIPSWRFRWCTDKFKIRQINKYIETPCTMFIGIDYGELKRQANNKSDTVMNKFPLIDAKMCRADCVDLIKDHGLVPPAKSGCWFCPFMPNIEVRELFLNHHDLYKKALEMEQNCMKGGFYLKGRPLPEVAMASTPPLYSYL